MYPKKVRTVLPWLLKNATVSFGYLPSAFELNGLDENYLGLYAGGGPWTLVSTPANLNSATDKITITAVDSFDESLRECLNDTDGQHIGHTTKCIGRLRIFLKYELLWKETRMFQNTK